MRHFTVGWTPPPGPARLPWVPSTAMLNWAPCGSSCLSPGLCLFPLKSGSCPVVVWGLCLESGFGVEMDAVDLGAGFPTCPRGTRWLPAMAVDTGAGGLCPCHSRHSSASAQPCQDFFSAGEVGGGGGSPGPPGSPGHPVPSPSQVLCQQRWRGLTLPSSGCFATAVPGSVRVPATRPPPQTRGAKPPP